jgi:hypothetical protein
MSTPPTSASTYPPVGGRTALFAEAWATLQDPWVEELAVSGHKPEFFRTPIQHSEPTPYLPTNEEERIALVHNRDDLLKKNMIEPATSPGFISRFALIPKRDSNELRPILNLRRLNLQVKPQTFQMQTLRVAINLLQEGWWMTKTDVKDAFSTIPLHGDFRHFFQFRILGVLFQYMCMPQGYVLSPFLWTRALKAVLRPLRLRGMILVAYLDDILLIAPSKDTCSFHTSILREHLQQFGYLINWAKSMGEPTQTQDFLGFLLNSLQMTVSLPLPKLKLLRRAAVNLLNKARALTPLTLRMVASLMGRLQATSQAIPDGRVFLRCIQHQMRLALRSNPDYESTLILSPLSILDLEKWVEILLEWNGTPLHPTQPTIFIDSDASDLGWGSICYQDNSRTRHLRGIYNLDRSELPHINVRELQAAVHGIQERLLICKGQSVMIRTDNVCTWAYINNKGGRVPYLNNIALPFLLWCHNHEISVHASFLVGRQNRVADRLSRQIRVDRTSWMLLPHVFNLLQLHFGKVSVDLFASPEDRQVPRFFSWLPTDHCAGVDAFNQDWSMESDLPYANPPFSQLGRLFHKVTSTQGLFCLLLVVPFWPTQPWWPTLLRLVCRPPVFLPGRAFCPSVPSAELPPPPWTSMALMISNNSLLASEFRLQWLASLKDPSFEVHNDDTLFGFDVSAISSVRREFSFGMQARMS